jgi:hypothetical protein
MQEEEATEREKRFSFGVNNKLEPTFMLGKKRSPNNKKRSRK